MNALPTLTMNTFIPPEADDSVFYYARRVARDNLSWQIEVDSTDCLVNMRANTEGLPTVSELRDAELSEEFEGGRTIYAGRVLISAGLILTVNGKVLMLQRDEAAPVDPLKWTSTAGRCDREPLLTALKESYEEVILFDRSTGRPVFVDFPDHSYREELREAYAETLARNGFEHPADTWIHLPAAIPSHFHPFLCEVTTRFSSAVSGENTEVFTGQFFPIFDKESNTLELRLLAELSIPPAVEANLGFQDGEYGRTAKLFDTTAFLSMPDSSLVKAMSHFKQVISVTGTAPP